MRGIIVATTTLATAALTVLFALDALWIWAVGIALMGLLWLTESWHGLIWVSTAGLLVFTTVVVMGAMFTLSPFWLLSSQVAVLVAWDLDRFAHYLDGVTDLRDKTGLVKGHLGRLGAVAGLGWLLGVVALNVRLNFDFHWTLALGLMLVISLSGAIRHMRRENG
jgi:hypothetical protein